VAEMDTAELLSEWRDWVRRKRQVLGAEPPFDVEEAQRSEMVDSELRIRGVLHEDEMLVTLHSSTDSSEQKPVDSFPERDQYLGGCLPSTAQFWETRVEKAREHDAHPVIMHALVSHMKQAHGAANIWRRMQRGS